MTAIALKSDCSNCAALCCVSLAFDKGDQFAIDKPAGVACPNLGKDHRCTIHENLSPKGFNGCIMYDCNGAGQRVTQDLFQGRSWQDDPKLLTPMMNAFRGMRLVHELLVLLNAAGKLPLTDEEAETHAALQAQLNPEEGWSNENLLEFEVGETANKTHAYLRTLRHHIEG